MSSRKNISETRLLELSQEQGCFETTAREWQHTGKMIDYFSAVELCQLCDQPDLRYHYEILNRHTKVTLQVGSSCIKKFDIAVYDSDGKELHGQSKSRQLEEEISAKHRAMMLEQLRELWRKASWERGRIEECVQEFKRRGGFSPGNLRLLFELMDQYEVIYTAPVYKVLLRSKQDRNELLHMPAGDRELIWPTLSPAQKRRVGEEQEKVVEVDPKAISPQAAAIILPEMPIRYVERSHKYRITFYDEEGRPINRIFRGGDKQTPQDIAEREMQRMPGCRPVEIHFTQTKELVGIFENKDQRNKNERQ